MLMSEGASLRPESDRDRPRYAPQMQVVVPEWVAGESEYRVAAGIDAQCSEDVPSREAMASADRVLLTGGWMAEHRLATLEGEPIGHASFRHLPTAVDQDVFVVRISVLAEHRSSGVGRTLHDVVEAEARGHGVRRLLGFVGGAEPAGRRFAQSLGYHEVGQSIEAKIDLTQVELDPVADVPGVAVVALADLKARSDWLDRLYRLFNAVESDTPFPIDEVPTPFDVFRARSVDADTAIPEAFLIAIAGDEWVGFTEVRSVPGNPRRWSQELTGVVRSHRGRGIARLLKQASLRRAQQSGVTTVRTWNDTTNVAILRINRHLGFTPRQTIHQVLKTVNDGESTRSSEGAAGLR